MPADVRYLDRIPKIRDELIKCAVARETITYLKLGRIVGIPTRGPWQGVLNRISLDEISEGRPDITHLIVNRRTRVSGQIDHRKAAKPTAEQRQMTETVRRACFDRYADKGDA